MDYRTDIKDSCDLNGTMKSNLEWTAASKRWFGPLIGQVVLVNNPATKR